MEDRVLFSLALIGTQACMRQGYDLDRLMDRDWIEGW